MLSAAESSPSEHSPAKETPEIDHPPLLHSGGRYSQWVREQYENVEDANVDSLNDNVSRLLIQFYGRISASPRDFFVLFNTVLRYASFLGPRFSLLTSLLDDCISSQLSASLMKPLIEVDANRGCEL